MKNNKLLPYVLVSPYIIHLLVFVAFPAVFSLYLTFNKWNIISPMEFIGFGNFMRVFQDGLFFTAIYNTLKFLIVHIPLQIIVALLLAEILNQKIILRPFLERPFSFR